MKKMLSIVSLDTKGVEEYRFDALWDENEKTIRFSGEDEKGSHFEEDSELVFENIFEAYAYLEKAYGNEFWCFDDIPDDEEVEGW